ncbi:MAG TPA: fumarylacetoacetase [Mycobacteriales bacterium]|nr:fumarylacetoacetase [Mycobacteriales bacterium]
MPGPGPAVAPPDLLEPLPYGVFIEAGRRRIGVRIGDQVLDVAAVDGARHLLSAPSLNPLMAAGRTIWTATRRWLISRLSDPTAIEPHLIPAAEVQMVLPFEVADFTDFYSSEDHARNLGRILRPDSPPLLPNWKHLPIGYHGRSGTVVVSGTPVVRPSGQRAQGDFGPAERLDFEAEIGFVVGTPGERIPLRNFAEHVFGVCLVNDWSARDIQAWEYRPLGPFLGKSFATSISPWIVPLDALQAARIHPPERDVPPLPYLDDSDEEPWGLDIRLEVRLNGQVISRPPFRRMYWTAAQQLAHLTSNGARVRTGDLYASGAISGAEPGSQGSLVELSENGRTPLHLPDGTIRTFLQDGDEVSISASNIGFGAVTGRIVSGR